MLLDSHLENHAERGNRVVVVLASDIIFESCGPFLARLLPDFIQPHVEYFWPRELDLADAPATILSAAGLDTHIVFQLPFKYLHCFPKLHRNHSAIGV